MQQRGHWTAVCHDFTCVIRRKLPKEVVDAVSAVLGAALVAVPVSGAVVLHCRTALLGDFYGSLAVLCPGLDTLLAAQGMKLKMKDMASKLGLGGSGNPFGQLGQ